jgi:hypothetical protein
MARVLRPARKAQALDVHRVVKQTPFITPEGEDQPSPSKPRTTESQVECCWSIRRFECEVVKARQMRAAKKPELDALLHHPHELAVIGIQDPALAALRPGGVKELAMTMRDGTGEVW